VTVCACGCGKEVPVQYNWHTKKYVQFIHGHNAIGRKLSEETKLKISMKLKAMSVHLKASPEQPRLREKSLMREVVRIIIILGSIFPKSIVKNSLRQEWVVNVIGKVRSYLKNIEEMYPNPYSAGRQG